jgi:NUMOD1 domain
MVKARATLLDMYNHFEQGSPVKSFIDSNCIYLTKPPVGDTGITKTYFDISDWTINNKLKMPVTMGNELTNSLQGKTGVYTLHSMPSGKFAIGSTTDFDVRFTNHYSDCLNPKLYSRLLYVEVNKVGGWDQFLWEPTVYTPNYYLDFIKYNLDYTSDNKVFRVLQTFTQYHARIYEQALQAYYQPELNGPGDITFTTTWDPNDVRPSKLGERPLLAITENGKTIEFLSMNSAADILGTSRKTISTVMNYVDTYVSCPTLGEKCRFVEPHLPTKSGNPYSSPYAAPDLEGIDYNKLPTERIYAFTESFELHSDYANSIEAAKACGLNNYYNVSRYINKRFVKCIIGGAAIKLLFAQNPLSKGGRKPVTCLDTTTNTLTRYSSVNQCARAIGSSDSSTLIKKFIRPGKLFKGKYLISYITES